MMSTYKVKGIWVLATLLSLVHTQAISQADYEIGEAYKTNAKSLMEESDVKSALAYIIELEAETEADHIALTEIEAPPFKEDLRGVAFKKMLEEAGLQDVRIDEVGNVIAMIKGKRGGRTVALDAHLDTVFPEGTDVEVKVKNDTLFAPGIGDDTRGLAMLLKHLFREGGPKIDSWISIDGGQLGRVNNKALGSYRYRVTFSGPGGHSWGAFGLVNPHHALGDAIQRFVTRANEYTMSGPRTSYNVGIISGGTSVNSIPFESIMEIDTRSVAQNKIKRRGPDLTVTVDMIGDRPSGELSADTPLIQRALALTAAMGKRPQLTRGSTNSNIPISLSIPAVTIGRGGVGAHAHSLDEWWLDKEGYKAIQLAFLLLLSEAGLAD